MKTSEQCITRAIELEALAVVCTDMDAFEYNQIAAQWRLLARQAAFHEAVFRNGPPLIH
jgi:hypothetical protein